jgi:hypothetical protein
MGGANSNRIESMKMETVIRSPQDGVIKKLAHKEGVSGLFRSRLGHGITEHSIGYLQGGNCFSSVRGRAQRRVMAGFG